MPKEIPVADILRAQTLVDEEMRANIQKAIVGHLGRAFHYDELEGMYTLVSCGESSTVLWDNVPVLEIGEPTYVWRQNDDGSWSFGWDRKFTYFNQKEGAPNA